MGMDIRQKNCPSRGALGFFLGGQQFKSLGKLSDWHQLWFTSADSSGNGHRLNTSRPSIPQGAFWGGGKVVTNSKVWGSCQTAGPIATKCGTHLQIHLGMDNTPNKLPLETQGGTWGGLGVKHSRVWEARVPQIQKYEEPVKRLDRLALNVAQICRSIWEWIHAKQIAPRYTRGGG